MTSSTPSMASTCWNCLTSEFFGSVSTLISMSRSSCWTAPTMGSRPMNSGMSPNLTMSSGSTWRKSSMSPLRLDSTG